MGIPISTAARIYKGQMKGFAGEDGSLSWEKLPHMSISKVGKEKEKKKEK